MAAHGPRTDPASADDGAGRPAPSAVDPGLADHGVQHLGGATRLRSVVAFARDPTDETFAAVRLLDPTTLSVIHGEGDVVADLVGPTSDLSPAELRQPSSWVLRRDGRSVSALDLIARAGDVSYVRTTTALVGCDSPDLPELGRHNVAIVPTQPGACSERFAVVLNGDSGRISEISVVLPIP